MLPSKFRLGRDEVKEVFDKGSRVSSQYGSVILLKHKQCKVAVVVSKKVAGSAVVRNSVRRRIYAVLEHIDPSIYPCYIAILPSKGLVSMRGEPLSQAIKDLLQKARLLVS